MYEVGMLCKHFKEKQKDIAIRDSILQNGIETTEEITRTSIINEQVRNIKQLTNEKEKGMERE